jgi:hypothetical protein
LIAIHLRQADVADQNVWSLGGECIQCFSTRRRDDDRGPVILQQPLEEFGRIGFIFDDQQPDARE